MATEDDVLFNLKFQIGLAITRVINTHRRNNPSGYTQEEYQDALATVVNDHGSTMCTKRPKGRPRKQNQDAAEEMLAELEQQSKPPPIKVRKTKEKPKPENGTAVN